MKLKERITNWLVDYPMIWNYVNTVFKNKIDHDAFITSTNYKEQIDLLRKELEEKHLETFNLQQDKINSIDNKYLESLSNLTDEVLSLKKTYSTLDNGLMLWDLPKLKNHIGGILSAFEVDVDAKVAACQSVVENIIVNEGNKRSNTVSLMRKIAELEGKTVAVENMRDIGQLLSKRDEYKSKLLEMDRKDEGYSVYETCYNTLEWVLGRDS